MKATRSIRFFGVIVLVLGLLMVWSVFWKVAPDVSDGGTVVVHTGDGGAGQQPVVESEMVADRDVAGEEAETLHGEAAQAALRENGKYESLGGALAAARHAVEKIDPDGPHARGAEYFAANPGQQLRAWFSTDGVELASGIPTPEDEEPWNLKLRLRGVGRGDGMTLVSDGPASGAGRRVEIEHHGAAVTQWFENRRDGLEQGFTIEERPEGQHGEVMVLLETEGSLSLAEMDEQSGICFVDDGGLEVLHYTGLKAWDATGRTLAARMEVRGTDSLALVVADAGARYPVTIDPMFANVEARLVVDSAAGDEIGSAVALVGDTALVGAPMDNTEAGVEAGSAYVFVRDGGVWRHETRLTAADGSQRAFFGRAVSLLGETAVVGAPDNEGSSGPPEGGSAYVFVRAGGAWSLQEKLQPPDGEAGNRFGCSVSVSGDTALVGASHSVGEPGDVEKPGAAYVFTRAGASWSQEQKLGAADAEDGNRFGASVALEGDTALVGAPYDDTAAGENAGSSHVFTRSGGTWSEQAELLPDDASGWDEFGVAVALSGDTALVGSDHEQAYVFTRAGASWSQQGTLTAADGGFGDSFGAAVALDGDTAVVGAHYADASVHTNPGSAYVFTRAGGIWSLQEKLYAITGAEWDRFGWALALSGETLLVGSPGDDTAAGGDAGSAHLFTRSGTDWSREAILRPGDRVDGDWAGMSVAADGDTALVGAWLANTHAGRTGAAYVFSRAGGGWSHEAKLIANDAAPNDAFGLSVSLSGDTALVGSKDDDNEAGENAGSVYVYVRVGSSWIQEAKLTADTPGAGDQFGRAVAVSGDTALVGSNEDDTAAGLDAGSADVFTRTGGDWSWQARLAPADAVAGMEFGVSVALSGDRAVVGASGDAAYVFGRAGEVWSQQEKLTAGDSVAGDWFGISVALSGDQVLVGAPGYPGAGVQAGAAYLFTRSGGIWSEQAKLTANDASAEDLFGFSVALSGNTALIGAPWDDTLAGADAGSAYVFTGSGALWSQQLKLTAIPNASAGDFFGQAVALSGDTALAGAPRDDSAGPDAGSVLVFLLGQLPEITGHPQARTVVPGQEVFFSVTATGHAPLAYQWRKDGSPIAGATGTSYTIASAQVDDQGNYDCVVSNIGGVATSAPATLTVNNLSQFAQTPPPVPSDANGFVIVNVTPADIGGAWRFVGEQMWRAPGVPVGGLPTGDRMIEFRAVPGWDHPGSVLASILSGGSATFLSKSYALLTSSGSGGLQVVLRPVDLAGEPLVEDRAQWRLYLPGSQSNLWLDSGATVSGLVPGDYQVECKWLDGWVTPPVTSVEVLDGGPTPVILTYGEPSPGTAPGVLPFETVSTSADLPYAYIGQLRSDVGMATGFVVKERVVATAGHVVFDDQTLSATTGVEWLFQRDRGSHEPAPMIPRGHRLMTGYAAQRVAEINAGGTPGVSSTASQELDVAALWFYEEAGRGGFSGFLASNALPDPLGGGGNQWLQSDALKLLVGYPVEGIKLDKIGRMHATPAADVSFEPGGSPHTYTTDEIRSGDGNSGGPLCVRFESPGEDPAWYPAAIYLGGSRQVVVRVIDDEVVELFNFAEAEGNGGDNSVGGGITHSETTLLSTDETEPGALQVFLAPPEATGVGAAWRLSTEANFVRLDGRTLVGLEAGMRTVQFKTVPGFVPPAQQEVEILGGRLLSITFTYAAENDDDDGDGFTNIDEFTAGTDPNDPNDFLRILTVERVEGGFTAEVAGKAGRVYELQLNEDALGGTWTTRASVGPLSADVGLSLTDPVAPPDHGYYRVRASKP